MSSVCCTRRHPAVPGAAKWGLYKTTDGGADWTFIHNGSATPRQCTGDATEFTNGTTCSPRGVRHVELDPTQPEHRLRRPRTPAASGARPTPARPGRRSSRRSTPAIIQTRAAFDVTTLPNGKTRMYVHEGNIGSPYSRLFRSDDVATGAPDVHRPDQRQPRPTPASPRYNLCTGQCWYDVFVHTPDGHPDIVYTGGSYVYGETIANKRAVVLSTDAGVTGTDMTFDGTDALHPNGLHPDQHASSPTRDNPFQFFEANDGGVMRSSGQLRRPLGLVRRPPNRGLTGRAAGPLPADAVADPVEARGRSTRA